MTTVGKTKDALSIHKSIMVVQVSCEKWELRCGLSALKEPDYLQLESFILECQVPKFVFFSTFINPLGNAGFESSGFIVLRIQICRRVGGA